MKVKFLGGAIKEQIAWGNNDDPNKFLKVGKLYEVKTKDIHRWHTKIILKEFPDKKFNDINFEYRK